MSCGTRVGYLGPTKGGWRGGIYTRKVPRRVYQGGYLSLLPGSLFCLFYTPREAKTGLFCLFSTHPGRLKRAAFASFPHPGRLEWARFASLYTPWEARMGPVLLFLSPTVKRVVGRRRVLPNSETCGRREAESLAQQ